MTADPFQRIIDRAESGEYVHPATLAMAKAEQPAKTCLSCLDWSLKASPMARHGLAACAKGERYVYLPASGKCAQHRAASAEAVNNRTAYFKKQEVKA